MILQHIKELFHRPHGPRQVSLEVPGLYPAERFQAVLDRERGRSDRNSHGFSLVIYDVAGKSAASAAGRPPVRDLAKALDRRTRATDEAGWIDPGRVGVLLPETYSEGAHQFALHIREECTANRVPVPPYSIRTYPMQPRPGGHGGGERRANRGGDERSSGASSSAAPLDARTGQTSTAYTPHGPALSAEDPVLEIRSLFARTLPYWKRALDIAGSALCLAALSPALLLTAAYIKLVSRGPVFFKQKRVGYLGRPFTMWKFRSMSIDNESAETHKQYLSELIHGQAEDQAMVKREPTLSIIPLGKVIRAACIDELPQLFNVLQGQMSLVGPRPPIPYEVDEYLHWHADRFETTPGMTGLWQVSGKNKLSFKEMIRLDIRYARNLSLGQDLAILLKTIPTVLCLAAEGLRGKLSKKEEETPEHDDDEQRKAA